MLKGLGGLGDMAKMMKAAQEMQGKMTALQEELARLTVEGVSGGGLVRVQVSVKGEVAALDIDPSILIASEKEVVEDLILAAIRDGQKQAEARQRQEMARMAREMGLPEGMNLPF